MEQKNILAKHPAEHAVEKTESTHKIDAKKLKRASSEGQTKEIGGPKGPEPTRYGDWEKRGRCIDF